MEYNEVLVFARSWGLVYLIVMFVGILGWTFWPSNRRRFDDAASIPLKED